MKIREGYILRQLAEEYMVVAVGKAAKDFNGMIRLNETGAFIWKKLETGCTEEELVRNILERYDGIDVKSAQKDLRNFLDLVGFAIDKLE